MRIEITDPKDFQVDDKLVAPNGATWGLLSAGTWLGAPCSFNHETAFDALLAAGAKVWREVEEPEPEVWRWSNVAVEGYSAVRLDLPNDGIYDICAWPAGEPMPLATAAPSEPQAEPKEERFYADEEGDVRDRTMQNRWVWGLNTRLPDCKAQAPIVAAALNAAVARGEIE